MSSEVQFSLSPGLNTKSKLQTHGYETAGGGEVEGSEWVASHSGSGIEAEAGVVWKWELHMGNEVEAMQVWWYGQWSEVGLVECAEQKWVYTIGASLVVCGR